MREEARAANALSRDLCTRHRLHKSAPARFEISAYTAHRAATKARSWSHRLQYFFDVDVLSGAEGCVFTAEDRIGYHETAELQRLVAEFTDHRRGRDRLNYIRRLLA